MALHYLRNILYKPNYGAFYRSKHFYEIPDVYKNSFFLANASLSENINYFAQMGYEKIFSDLVDKEAEKDISTSIEMAQYNVNNLIKYLDNYDSITDMNFPIRRKNGDVNIVRGLRVYHGLTQHNSCMGGFRLCPNLSREHSKGYSILSMYRHACFGLEFAGAHGGLAISHLSLTPDELKDAVQTYIHRLKSNNGFVDIIEPDINCGTSEMDWMSSACIDNTNLYVMGRSGFAGGINNYEEAGAKAAIYTLKLFMANNDAMDRIDVNNCIKDKTFIIQGLGKLGSKIATMMTDMGAICIGIKEIDCCLYDTKGVNVNDVLEHRERLGTILGFSLKAKPMTDHLILTQACDILIFAASHRSLSCYAADKVQASIILEAANATTSPMAHKILVNKSKLIIPDIISGSGSTIMSYLEFMRLNNKQLNTDELRCEDDLLNQMLELTTSEICKINKDLNLGLDYRTAAYVKAIYKIFGKAATQDSVKVMKNVG